MGLEVFKKLHGKAKEKDVYGYLRARLRLQHWDATLWKGRRARSEPEIPPSVTESHWSILEAHLDHLELVKLKTLDH